MVTLNAKQILSNLYGLMMEINYHRQDEDVITELNSNPDPQIEKHLLRIKQLTTRLKAEANKALFQRAFEQIKVLKQRGLEELKNLVKPQDQEKLIPLFRKFEELTEEDEAAILEDQELLHLLEILKERLDENPE